MMIIYYLILYIITYYYCRWIVMKRFGKSEWQWDDVVICLLLSTMTLLTMFLQTIIYYKTIFKTEIKIKIPKPPKWL